MKILKSGLFCLLAICCFAFSTPLNAASVADADPIVTTAKAPTVSLRNEIKRLMHNPDYQSIGQQEAYVDLQFKINVDGELILLSSSSESDYLLDFATQRLHLHKIDGSQLLTNTPYRVKIKFELK